MLVAHVRESSGLASDALMAVRADKARPIVAALEAQMAPHRVSAAEDFPAVRTSVHEDCLGGLLTHRCM